MASKGNRLIFANAEKARDAITESQKKEIAKLYQQWADEIGERAKYYSHKSTSSSVVSERQMKELKKQLTETSHQVSNEVYKNIKSNIYTVSDAVVKDNIEWLKQFGFSEAGLNAAFSSVPDQIVRMLVTGQIYEGGWNLSSRIWSDNESTLKTAYQIVAKGMAENRPIYDIAKELEKYVQPGAVKKWNPYIMMKNTKTGEWERKKIYKRQVDYNAQRLARTLVQHGYQQSFIAVTERNPFVLRYQWSANGSRPCPLCMDRDGQEFAKGDLPMDHPNGQCTMIPVIDDNMADKLADWFNSPDGTYPEIDEFAKGFGYTPSIRDTNVTKPTSYISYTSNDRKQIEQMYKDQIKGYTKEEKSGIVRYTGTTQKRTHEYENINQYLRGQKNNISAANQKAIDGIDSAINKFEVKEPFVAIRGVNLDTFDDVLNGARSVDEVKAALEGIEFTDKGFMSTSWNTWDGFYRDAELHINVPSGTGIGCMTDNFSESEFILKRGTSLEIKSVEAADGGMVRIYCDVIR